MTTEAERAKRRMEMTLQMLKMEERMLDAMLNRLASELENSRMTDRNSFWTVFFYPFMMGVLTFSAMLGIALAFVK